MVIAISYSVQIRKLLISVRMLQRGPSEQNIIILPICRTKRKLVKKEYITFEVAHAMTTDNRLILTTEEFIELHDRRKVENFKLILNSLKPFVINEYLTVLRGRTDKLSMEMVQLADKKLKELEK